MNLTPETVGQVRKAVEEVLHQYAPETVTGISCLARGADTIFAEAVLKAGCRLEVILPATDYRHTKVKPDHAPIFDSLIGQAFEVRTMPFQISNREAYEAANDALLASCDQLIAVWDGRESNGKGGTGDVVAAARSRGIPVRIVWPDGAQRMTGEAPSPTTCPR